MGILQSLANISNTIVPIASGLATSWSNKLPENAAIKLIIYTLAFIFCINPKYSLEDWKPLLQLCKKIKLSSATFQNLVYLVQLSKSVNIAENQCFFLPDAYLPDFDSCTKYTDFLQR